MTVFIVSSPCSFHSEVGFVPDNIFFKFDPESTLWLNALNRKVLAFNLLLISFTTEVFVKLSDQRLQIVLIAKFIVLKKLLKTLVDEVLLKLRISPVELTVKLFEFLIRLYITFPFRFHHLLRLSGNMCTFALVITLKLKSDLFLDF